MIEIAILIFMLLYAALIIYLIIIILLVPHSSSTTCASGFEGISIVIPVKNEEHHISMLVDGLMKQNYPAAVEIIFVDDRSEDSTQAIIEKESKRCTIPIRCIPGRYDGQRNLTSKQQAIDLGIKEASLPLIAFTDADMSLYGNWLSALAGSLQPQTDLVFGHTIIEPREGAFVLFQSFQLEVLFSVASLFHYCGILGSCMGNNILLRKTAYLECGGHDAIGYCITEDRALLRHFRRSGRKTAIVTPFQPTASTEAHDSPLMFYRQIVRWARGGFTNGTGLLFFGGAFAAQNTAAILGAAGILGSGIGPAGLQIFLLTWLLIAITFKKNNAPVSAFGFVLFYPLLIIEVLLLLPALIAPFKIVWKGNKV